MGMFWMTFRIKYFLSFFFLRQFMNLETKIDFFSLKY
jgi:hypothetical protein